MPRRSGLAEQQWRERLRRFDRNDLTILEFCERERVATSSFYSWRRRLAPDPMPGPRPARSAERPLFVPVSVRSAATTGVQIELPGGAIVRIPPAADEGLLRCCIRAAAELGHDDAEDEAC